MTEKAMQKLLDLQSEYIKLLGDELEEVVPIASIHGWKSSRYEAGLKLREEIKQVNL